MQTAKTKARILVPALALILLFSACSGGDSNLPDSGGNITTPKIVEPVTEPTIMPETIIPLTEPTVPPETHPAETENTAMPESDTEQRDKLLNDVFDWLRGSDNDGFGRGLPLSYEFAFSGKVAIAELYDAELETLFFTMMISAHMSFRSEYLKNTRKAALCVFRRNYTGSLPTAARR